MRYNKANYEVRRDRMANEIPFQTRKLIAQRYQETQNRVLVGKEFGVYQGKVKKICKEFGVPIRKTRGKPDLNNEQWIQQYSQYSPIFEMINQTQDTEEIAKHIGVSPSQVNRVLRRFGMGIGIGTNNRKFFLPEKEIIARYQAGEGCQEIAKDFGCGREVVRRKLKKLGVPRRVGKAAGNKNPQWKGGYKTPMHYYRRQSYEVVAICLGKPLPQGCIIHHLDENPKNNNPNNLVLFPSQKHHAKFHQEKLKIENEGREENAIHLVSRYGGIKLPESPDHFQLEYDINDLFPLNN